MIAFNLDKVKVDITCPTCQFLNSVTIKQARVRDVIICRGCKVNIQLEDHMNTVRKSVRDFRRALRQLEKQLSQISEITINL